MSTTIISKQLYFHPLSDKGFSTKLAADKAYRAALDQKKKDEEEQNRLKQLAERQEELANYVRLNVESIDDILPTLTKNIKDIFGFDFDLKISNLSFREISNSHAAPIGKKTNWSGRDKDQPTSYLGWRGSISGKYAKVKRGGEKTIGDCLGTWTYDNSIKGFHTGCGGGGDKGWQYEFYFFLDDFPKLAAKYKEYSKYQQELTEEQEQKSLAKNNWLQKNQEIYYGKPEVVTNLEKIADLHEEIERLQRENGKIKEEIDNKNPFEYPVKFTEDGLQKLNVGF